MNRPAGNVTHTARGVFAAVGVISRVPDAVFRIPVIVPSALNVNGPHLPPPFPLTSKLPAADLRTAGTFDGNVFVLGGLKIATPVGAAEAVTSSGTADLAQ